MATNTSSPTPSPAPQVAPAVQSTLNPAVSISASAPVVPANQNKKNWLVRIARHEYPTIIGLSPPLFVSAIGFLPHGATGLATFMLMWGGLGYVSSRTGNVYQAKAFNKAARESTPLPEKRNGHGTPLFIVSSAIALFAAVLPGLVRAGIDDGVINYDRANPSRNDNLVWLARKDAEWLGSKTDAIHLGEPADPIIATLAKYDHVAVSYKGSYTVTLYPELINGSVMNDTVDPGSSRRFCALYAVNDSELGPKLKLSEDGKIFFADFSDQWEISRNKAENDACQSKEIPPAAVGQLPPGVPAAEEPARPAVQSTASGAAPVKQAKRYTW